MVPVNELPHLWADLDQCDPLELPHAESMEIAKNWIECRCEMQFLKGLNQGFESRHALVFIDEAIAAMSLEEVRLQSRGGHGNELAYRVADQQGPRGCYSCGHLGHVSFFAQNLPAEAEVEGIVVAVATEVVRMEVVIRLGMVVIEMLSRRI